jgi:hypothetical protein
MRKWGLKHLDNFGTVPQVGANPPFVVDAEFLPSPCADKVNQIWRVAAC